MKGFGLPVIEAMVRRPGITGQVPALSETAGGAVEQIERLMPRRWRAMVALAYSRERRDELVALGAARAGVPPGARSRERSTLSS
jgi:hypothetical protein